MSNSTITATSAALNRLAAEVSNTRQANQQLSVKLEWAIEVYQNHIDQARAKADL